MVDERTEYLIQYDGPVVILTDATQMEDSKTALTSNRQTHCHLYLRSRPLAAVIWPWDEQDFAKAHIEQNMIMDGTVEVADETSVLDGGSGLRDRAWGACDWHHFDWHRWLTMNFGHDLGRALFVTSVGAAAEPREIVAAHIDTKYDQRTYAKRARVHLETADGKSYDIDGEAWSMIPLRHRQDGAIARLTEEMATWRIGDRRGVGPFEYFDQIVDGVRVGP